MKNICFTEQEKKSLALMGLKPGIHIIAFVPISCDPLYHMQPANFVTYKDNCNEGWLTIWVRNRAFWKLEW